MGEVNQQDKNISISASFYCAVCGKEASHVTLTPAGQPDPRLTPETSDMPEGVSKLMIGVHKLSIDGGPATYTVGVTDEDFKRVKDALLSQNAAQLYAIDGEYAPFWCPKCECCYCGKHYTSETVFEDVFFDCIYGTCPKGHKRILTD